MLYDQVFLHMKETEASIFTFNETHGNNTNPSNGAVLNRSKNRIFNQKDGRYCQIVTSSSLAPVTNLLNLEAT